MSYKIIEIVTIGQLAKDMEAAEKEGYVYVGASANPGGSTVFMHHRDGPKRVTPGAMSMVSTLLRDAVCTDGAHHKQWYLEQIAALMEVKLPEHDEGIAP